MVRMRCKRCDQGCDARQQHVGVLCKACYLLQKLNRQRQRLYRDLPKIDRPRPLTCPTCHKEILNLWPRVKDNDAEEIKDDSLWIVNLWPRVKDNDGNMVRTKGTNKDVLVSSVGTCVECHNRWRYGTCSACSKPNTSKRQKCCKACAETLKYGVLKPVIPPIAERPRTVERFARHIANLPVLPSTCWCGSGFRVNFLTSWQCPCCRGFQHRPMKVRVRSVAEEFGYEDE